MLTSLGVARPGLLVFTSGHQSQADLFLPWSSGLPALGPLPSPRPWVHRPPPRRHRHRRPAVGNRRPGNRPKRRLREWNRDRAAAVGPEHSVRHSFLLPSPAAALGPRAQRFLGGGLFSSADFTRNVPPPPPLSLASHHPHRPSCDSPRPPRPGATATAAWPAAGDRCPSALDPTPAFPGTRPPLPDPREQSGDWDSYPPWSRCPVRKFFSKFLPRKSRPPRHRPAPKNFITKNPGREAGTF